MTLVMAGLDRWADLGNGCQIFLRADALVDPGYRVRLEVGGRGVEVRCLSPLPGGFWLRPHKGGPLYVPGEYGTQEFRRDAREGS